MRKISAANLTLFVGCLTLAVGCGTNTVAGHNLGLTELALRNQAEGEIPIVENPVALQREGTSEYRLLEAVIEEEELDG